MSKQEFAIQVLDRAHEEIALQLEMCDPESDDAGRLRWHLHELEEAIRALRMHGFDYTSLAASAEAARREN
jgi:hypothetical protein